MTLRCRLPITGRCTHRGSTTLSAALNEALRIEFSDLHVSKEDSVDLWCDQFESQLLKAEYLANEDSGFVSADVAAVIHPSEEVSVVLASGRSNGTNVLRDAAAAYKIDIDAITFNVKQEFSSKEKAKKAKTVSSGARENRKAA